MVGRLVLLRDEAKNAEVVTAGTGEAFERFVTLAEPRLRRALVAVYGPEEGRDATAEALACSWEHWERVNQMRNPTGYLFRVAQSKGRRRRTRAIYATPEVTEVEIEPRLLHPRLGRRLGRPSGS